MPQLQTLVLTDRATPTPVNHTFVPRDINSQGVGTVVNNAGTPIGEKRASVSSRKRANGGFAGELRIAVPIVATETINGVSSPKVVRTSYARVEFTFDETSTEQERKDIVGMTMSALDPAKVLVNDTFVKLEGVY